MIGIEVLKPTAVGTGTTKTQLGGADLTLPAWARSIVAIEVSAIQFTPTADESLITAVSLESDDFNVAPFEVLAPPLTAGDVTNIGQVSSRKEVYAVNAAVNGGDALRVFGKALVGNTVAPYMAVSVIISSEPPAFTQRHAKIGTLTATGTTANTDVAGTAYTFTAGHRLIEVVGVMASGAVVISKPFAGYMRFESSEFAAPTPLKLLLEPVHGVIGTGASSLAGVSRAKVDIQVRSPTTIQDYLNLALVSSTAGNFVSGVIFE